MADEPQQADSPKSTSLFDGLLQVWRVIDHGDPDWGVPAYNGGLFGTDSELHPDGAAIEKLALTNDILGPALRGLLVDVAKDGTLGPVDFRSLDVRDFGTIYEGLLEAGLSIAEDNLADDGKGGWKVAEKGDTALVKKTHPYFHTKSGDRKATGSYFTPSFVVEHLLERSLDPALDTHLARVAEILTGKGDQVGAARAFFDFRVADLAMGSGHFLVAAISHIEQKFGSFLERYPLPGVEKELIELKDAAAKALAEVGVDAEIDRSGLLSRQIAKRCVYGIDINEIAVELSRLAIWVRTFVPGLPMSSLDHQLVWGNSVTGIGTIAEAIEILAPNSTGHTISFTESSINAALASAKSALDDAAAIKESTSSEIRKTQDAYKNAEKISRPVHRLMDVALAIRIGAMDHLALLSNEDFSQLQIPKDVMNTISVLAPVHFPIRFPEVFMRERSGFDVLIGNPPWEKLHVKEDAWWTLRSPGLMSLKPKEKKMRIEQLEGDRPDLVRELEREREVDNQLKTAISKGPYPDIGAAHIDLYVVFAWRNWSLLNSEGQMGIVLPRGAFVGAGTATWRREVLERGSFSSLVLAVNERGWIFEGVEPRLTVVFTNVSKLNSESSSVGIVGPLFSLSDFLAERTELGRLSAATLLSSESAAIPAVKHKEDAGILSTMARHPGLVSTEGFEFRLVQGDINITTGRDLFSIDRRPSDFLPVLSGGSISLWDSEHSDPFGWAGKELADHLLSKAKLGTKNKASSYYGLNVESSADVEYTKPRIVVRQISRATDTRTCITTLIPGQRAVASGLHYLHRRQGTVADEAYLLGILASIPFDWYLRSWVELNVTFDLLYPCPVPRPSTESPIRRRVVELAGRRAATNSELADWAQEVGVASGPLEEKVQNCMVYEIDALVALLYGLSSEQLTAIFAGFHRNWDYEERLAQVLKYYEEWAAKT